MKRRRPFGLFALFSAMLAGVAATPSSAEEKPAPPRDVAHSTQVVFVTGDDEYGSEISMPMIAAILEQRHGMKATVLYAEDDQGQRDRHGNHIPGLEALRTADAAVFFMRYRQLPDDQLREIVEYAASGRPMIGLRTTTHAFNYEAPPNNKWNNAFGREYFGQQWISHHGHNNSSEIAISAAAADEPILRGVEPRFWVHSWLYNMSQGDLRLPDDCRILLEGDATRGTEPGGEKYGTHEPVAWTREMPVEGGATRRVFYTSLGHPRDFAIESPRRLLVNAVYWCLGREAEIPAEGANVEIVGEYDPPDPH
jgi:type 1 glutamine amidotransferase